MVEEEREKEDERNESKTKSREKTKNEEQAVETVDNPLRELPTVTTLIVIVDIMDNPAGYPQ